MTGCARLLAGLAAPLVAAPLERVPLEPAGEPREMRFTTLPPEATGLHAPNRFADPTMWGEAFERFAYGAIGTGVAVGDFDSDGRPDVYVVGKSDPDRLFRNVGGWRFEDVTAAAGVLNLEPAWKQGVSFVDVNNDRRLDLYVCRLDAPNLLYVNQGDGTFREEGEVRGLALRDASGMAAFADYDRDGWLDVYIATNLLDHAARPDGEADRLYRNRGDGTFEDVTERAGLFGAAQTHAAVWWDYNADGWPDVYATNDFGWPDQLWRNNGDGTFTNTIDLVVPHLPRFSMGADVADVNNDGHFDLYVGDMLPTTRARDQRSMADARAHVADPAEKVTPQYLRNALYVNTGSGRMLEAAHLAGLAATDWTWSLRFEDFDNDGWVDLHVTNGMVREFFDVDLRQRLEGLPPAERRRAIFQSPRLDEANLVYRNRGDLEFEEAGTTWALDHRGVSFGAATGDLDGDGDLDLVFSNYEGALTVCRNDGTGGNRLLVELAGTRSNRFGVGAVVRIETESGVQVRQLGLARGYLSSSEPVLHFGLGVDRVVRRLVVQWPSGHEQVIDDVEAGFHYHITEPSTEPGPPARPGPRPARVQYVEVGGFTRLAVAQPAGTVDELATEPLLPFRLQDAGPGVAVADLDGDGREEVTLGGAGASPARMLRSLGGARFGPPAPLAGTSPAPPDAAPLFFEADGDGDLDLVLAKSASPAEGGPAVQAPLLYLNDGDGHFTPAPDGTVAPVAPGIGPVVAADFDRDGRLDVFLGARSRPDAYPRPQRSLLLHNRGDGRLADVASRPGMELGASGLVGAARWTDVDQDGWMDLLVASHWGPVRCWRNLEGRGFEDVSERLGFAAAGYGWWNSIAAADWNGDGRLDYAVGNLGLNTRYRATLTRPYWLLRGTFDPSGREHLIEAEENGAGRLEVVRSRALLNRVFPALRRRFPTAAAFAQAHLAALFGPESVDRAERYRLTELRSGVFFSRDDGSFGFEPLPRLAQVAPLHGMVAGDFDGDANPDLYVVMNWFAPVPETGRFDGGLSQLLRGDGRGGFELVPHAQSNLLVPGDARGLAIFDPDGDSWPDFLITRSRSHALVYANTGVAGRRMLRVDLAGPPGNPGGIGARITAESVRGRRQVDEIAAGGGYWSQSLPSAFFGQPEGDPIRQVVVAWPDGSISEHAIAPDASRVRLRATPAALGEGTR